MFAMFLVYKMLVFAMYNILGINVFVCNVQNQCVVGVTFSSDAKPRIIPNTQHPPHIPPAFFLENINIEFLLSQRGLRAASVSFGCRQRIT